jgi:hypothetical protein
LPGDACLEETMTNPDILPSPTPAPVRRPYTAPRLIVHGDVASLTLGKTGALPDVESAGSHNVGLM